MEKKIFVYISINNNDVLLGTVFVDNHKGKETYSFEYSNEALTNNLSNYIIDDDLTFVRGRQFKRDSSSPYHFLEDSSPDRWGRNLIKRIARNKNLQFSDYLLGVSDISRMGALRYKLDVNGSFLGEDDNIPPLEFLNKFEDAAYHYNEFDLKEDWKILLSPGSSLGGARPKATFYDGSGAFYLAKFNHKNDDYDISKIEYLTYRLAIKCDIDLMESKLITLDNKRSIFLTKRFDRDNKTRYHYTSFMTLLDAKDGDSNNHSYLEIVESLLKVSNQPEKDLAQLFRRIAFSIIFHNYDNHLRNHGMIFKDKKWQLSPAFDLNISPYYGQHVLTIDGNGATLDDLIENSFYFRLDKKTAFEIIKKMRNVAKTSLMDICQELRVEKGLAKQFEQLILGE